MAAAEATGSIQHDLCGKWDIHRADSLHKAPDFSKCIGFEENINLPFIKRNNQMNRYLIPSKTPSNMNGVILKISTRSRNTRIKST